MPQPHTTCHYFFSKIPRDSQDSSHQFILKPVSGEGRVGLSSTSLFDSDNAALKIMFNHTISRETPRLDMQWLFDEISLTLDHDQYLDTISLVDMYHVYLRRQQVSPLQTLGTLFLTFSLVPQVSTKGRRNPD
jgi:vacuolar protein sorting-associated protein 13A/C